MVQILRSLSNLHGKGSEKVMACKSEFPFFHLIPTLSICQKYANVSRVALFRDEIQVSKDPYHGCIQVLSETFHQDISRRTRTEGDKSAA